MQYYDIIVETVKETNLKYKYDPAEQRFKLKKSLPLGMVFPYDFGFIENTRGEDGDPLDAMVISEFSSVTGCKMKCRLVGVLTAEQTEGRRKTRNDRYFFIPDESVIYASIRSIKDLGKKHNDQLTDFFINYNKAEGRVFRPLQLLPAQKASQLLKRSNAHGA